MIGNLLNALIKFFFANIFQFLKNDFLAFPHTKYTKGQQSAFLDAQASLEPGLSFTHSVPKYELFGNMGNISHRHISDISQANLRQISGISQAYLRQISDISQLYLRHISVISQAYLNHISDIFQAYLGNV